MRHESDAERGRARVPMLALVLGLTACSALTDTGGLGTRGSATVDGGPTTSSDSGPSPHASSSTDGSVAIVPPCTPSPKTFCSDFDLDTALERWSVGRDISGSASVDIDKTDARSLPNALLATLPSSGNNCASASIETALVGNHSRATGSVSVRYKFPGLATLMLISFGTVNERCEAFINADGGQAAVLYQVDGDQSLTKYRKLAIALPEDTWARLTADVDMDAHTVTVTVNGASDTVSVPGCPYDPGDAFFALGFRCEESISQSRVTRFDDARFEVP